MVIEIVMIVLGLALVIAGYLIPAGKEKEDTDEETFSREQVQEIVSEEMESAKGRISDMVDETITYAMEKTERSMDRLSNEKMMAVSEYSDTVLDQINKSHEEVVFLYDMLNDKHENLKETVAEAARTATEVSEKIKAAEDLKPIVVSRVDDSEMASVVAVPEKTVKAAEKEKPAEKTARSRTKQVPVIKSEPVAAPKEDPVPEEDDSWEEEWDDFSDDDYDEDDDSLEINFNNRAPGSRNNNDRILELHKAGKSNMAIAKELGLGVGEVKLVIDLFKGSKS